MSEQDFKYVFGPVPSRRLGRSMGVDLVPFKTCTYDCLYCQLGFTTEKSAERREYVPLAEVLKEIKRKLISGTKPDFVTLSGSGEPTLYSRLGELIDGIKRITDTKVAVITNSSMLWNEEVRTGISKADLVVPSLDAGDAETLKLINRHCDAIDFDIMVDGLVSFAQGFAGEIWLEIFFLQGVNDTDTQVQKMLPIVEKINPARIQLNTVARPTADKGAKAVAKEDLERFAEMFGDRATVIASYPEAEQDEDIAATQEDVLATVGRRPCSVADIAAGLKIHRNEALKYIEHLLKDGRVKGEDIDGVTYYSASGQ